MIREFNIENNELVTEKFPLLKLLILMMKMKSKRKKHIQLVIF